MTVTAMEEGSVGLLEDNAAKRKERLAALKRKLQTQAGEESGAAKEGEEEDDSLPTPVFRSYKPQAPELQESAFDQADPHLIEEKIQVEVGSHNGAAGRE